jgi:hypothetical protein
MDELNCQTVRASLWDYAARKLDGGLREAIAAHLGACRDCRLHDKDARSMSDGLRYLPVRSVPPILNTRLRVMASRDRSRRAVRRDFESRMKEIRACLALAFDNLLKPVAVPASGGLLASFFCFCLLANSLHVHIIRDIYNDVPIGISTEASFGESSPFSVPGDDLKLQLTVGADGRVTDWKVLDADPTPEELQQIGNVVLFSTFTPALRDGEPVSSQRVLQLSHCLVRG